MDGRIPWTAIGTIATIFALGLAAWLGYTAGTLAPPQLEFGFGLIKAYSGGDLRRVGLSKSGPITYLVLMTDAHDARRAAFVVPFYVANRSSRALRDVLVRIRYPSRSVVDIDKVILVDPPSKPEVNPDYAKLRTIRITEPLAVAEFQIGILRPSEGMILGEALIFGDPALIGAESTRSKNIRALTFPERLREQIDLLDVVRIETFAASAEAGPYTPSLTAIWCRVGQEKLEETVEAVGDRIEAAAWGPYRPKLGYHIKWPWQSKLWTNEFFEYLKTPLARGIDASGQTLFFAHGDQTRMVRRSSAMPPWNYWGPVNK